MQARVILLGLILVGPHALASEQAPCNPTESVSDPPGDVDTTPSTVHYSAPEADITNYTISISNDTLWLNLTLAKSPVGESGSYFRYWLGFSIARPMEKPEYMDARIASTATYDHADVVSSNKDGNKNLATVHTTWNGASLTVPVEMKTLREAYGEGVAVGMPLAGTDGIHKSLTLQGPAEALPYIHDDAALHEFQALVPCPSMQPAATPTPQIVTAKTPGPSLLVEGVVLALGAMVLRRR